MLEEDCLDRQLSAAPLAPRTHYVLHTTTAAVLQLRAVEPIQARAVAVAVAGRGVG